MEHESSLPLHPNFSATFHRREVVIDLLMLLSDWYDIKRILHWVVGRHLPVKVKMDGAVGYGVGSVSEQSVHEVVSRIRDAVNRVIDVLILLFCTKVAVF
jgi:hypothetical protein